LYETFDALDACYAASWQLPFGGAHGEATTDFHRLADDSLAGHGNDG